MVSSVTPWSLAAWREIIKHVTLSRHVLRVTGTEPGLIMMAPTWNGNGATGLSELNLHSEEMSDLIYPSFHIHADSAGTLVQHSPLGPVVEQPCQAHPLLLPS